MFPSKKKNTPPGGDVEGGEKVVNIYLSEEIHFMVVTSCTHLASEFAQQCQQASRCWRPARGIQGQYETYGSKQNVSPYVPTNTPTMDEAERILELVEGIHYIADDETEQTRSRHTQSCAIDRDARRPNGSAKVK